MALRQFTFKEVRKLHPGVPVIKGRVLVHEAYVNVVAVSFAQVIQHLLRVEKLPRKHEVPYQDSALHYAVFAHLNGASLAVHLGDGLRADIKVVGTAAKLRGQGGGEEFHIRHVYVYKPVEHLKGFDGFVSSRIEYDGDVKTLVFGSLDRISDARDEVSCSYEIDVVNPLGLQLKIKGGEFLRRIFAPRARGAAADVVVLTEYALEAAAFEEYRSAASRARYRGLFASVDGIKVHDGDWPHTAESTAARCTVGSAGPRANYAVSIFRSPLNVAHM